jgi:hypothetical protein
MSIGGPREPVAVQLRAGGAQIARTEARVNLARNPPPAAPGPGEDK